MKTLSLSHPRKTCAVSSCSMEGTSPGELDVQEEAVCTHCSLSWKEVELFFLRNEWIEPTHLGTVLVWQESSFLKIWGGVWGEQQCHVEHELEGVHVPVSWFLSREGTSCAIGTRIDYLNIVLIPPSHFTQKEEWMGECVSASAPNLHKHSKSLGHETPC